MPDAYIIEIAITLSVAVLQLAAFVTTVRAALRLSALFPTRPWRLQLADVAPGSGRVVLELPAPVSAQAVTLLRTTNDLLAAADASRSPFDVIADVAHRAAARLDERAAATANVPVFLGLMGTFAGVIAGLAQMSLRGGLTEDGIHLLLGGVLVAMIASLSGVCLMVLSNAIILPFARREADERLDAYLLAAQVLLGARDDRSTAAVIDASADTQADPAADDHDPNLVNDAFAALATFNRDFETQVGRFHGAVSALSESVHQQSDLIHALKTLNLDQTIRLNVQLLSQANVFLERYADFGESLRTLKASADGSGELIARVAKLMDRVTQFEDSVNALGERIASDQTVTGRTVALIQAQLDAIRDRTDLVQQYVALEDDRVRALAAQHREQIANLGARAAQSIDRVGEQMAAEVARAAEPTKVQGLLDHVARLPGLVEAVAGTAKEGVIELQRARAAEDTSLEELRQMTLAVRRASDQGLGPAIVRATRRLLGRTEEVRDAGSV